MASDPKMLLDTQRALAAINEALEPLKRDGSLPGAIITALLVTAGGVAVARGCSIKSVRATADVLFDECERRQRPNRD